MDFNQLEPYTNISYRRATNALGFEGLLSQRHMDLRVWSYPGSNYIYSKFHRNPLKGFGATGCRNLTSPIHLASGLDNSLYYRVQAVMLLFFIFIIVLFLAYANKRVHNVSNSTVEAMQQK